MRRTMYSAFVAVVLGTVPSAQPAKANPVGYYEVVGVEDGDMLKMREGPGTGYEVIAGLPNGTILRIHDCDQIGSTAWCKVSLKRARSLKGYVSWNYLQEN